jgi:DNA mismatch endonuclease (patch repair protein)
MSKIRSKNTGLEKSFLRLLKKSTSREFKTHVKAIRGTPDIVFEKEKICVFLDGDFWHGWQFPRWKHQMKSEFWRNKIEENRRRDKRVQRHLKNRGWMVIRFWEHEVQTKPHELIRIIKDYLMGNRR